MAHLGEGVAVRGETRGVVRTRRGPGRKNKVGTARPNIRSLARMADEEVRFMGRRVASLVRLASKAAWKRLDFQAHYL